MFVLPVQPCPPMDLQFPLTVTHLQQVGGPSAPSTKSLPRFKPERVIRSSSVLQVTSTPGFHLAILFLSAILFH